MSEENKGLSPEEALQKIRDMKTSDKILFAGFLASLLWGVFVEKGDE